MIAVGLLATACGGGSSGSGSSSSSTGVTAGGATGTTSPTPTSTTPDTTAPTFTIDSTSGPNTFQDGQAVLSGTAGDSESGVASVTINGVLAGLTGPPAQPDWDITPQLRDGVNKIEIVVTDVAGNQTKDWWCVYYADHFLAPQDAIADAMILDISQDGFDYISLQVTDYLLNNNALAIALVNQAISQGVASSLNLNINSVTFDAPDVAFTTDPAGLNTVVTVDNIDFDNGTITIGSAQVDLTLHIAVSAGAYVVTVPSANFTLANVGGVPSTMLPLVSAALQAAMVPLVQTAVQTALTSFTPSYTQNVMGVDYTLTAEPTDIIYTANSLQVVIGANATSTNTGNGGGPGSLGVATAPAPVFTAGYDLGVFVSNELVNRAGYAAWDGGSLALTIDQNLLSTYGVNLPFQLDGRFLALFFPQINSLIVNPNQIVPIGIQLAMPLPPSFSLEANTPNVRMASFSHVAIVMDFGTGFTSILGLELFGEIAADVSANATAASVTPVAPTTFDFRIAAFQNPLSLDTSAVSSLLNNGVSQLITLFGSLVPAFPLPAIPQVQGMPHIQLDTLDTDVQPEGLYIDASFK
jgi:hypothetical protein